MYCELCKRTKSTALYEVANLTKEFKSELLFVGSRSIVVSCVREYRKEREE